MSPVEKLLAEHDDPPGWTGNEVDRPVYQCSCGDRSPALDRDYIGPEDVEWAAAWHRAHLAEVLRGDEVVETVAKAIWQANAELTKPEHRNMPDGEARAYFARAALAAIFGSSDE